MEELIERFCSVTGSNPNVASHFLQMTNGDIDNAITFYFDSDQSEQSQQTVDSNNFISQDMQTIEESRQPIPQKHERLIEPEISPGVIVRSRIANRNISLENESHNNPFLASGSVGLSNQNGSGSSSLDKLFEPPAELLFTGTFEEAKQYARDKNAWLLVSVHNNEIYDCHRLNRDLWKNQKIKNLVKQSFVLWQVFKHRLEAHNIMQWYRYDKDNAHLAVIDPVTGECKMSFIGPEICEPNEMHKILSSFIQDNSRNSSSSTRKRIMNSDPDSDSDCIDLTESIPRMKKMKILSPLSDSSEAAASCSDQLQHISSSESWLDYLGRGEDPIYTILIRLPTGVREIIAIPSSSKLKALFLYVQERGFEMSKYELIKCFPKEILTLKMSGLTLENCGIVNRDTIHVQENGC